jgi:hypothetical protein
MDVLDGNGPAVRKSSRGHKLDSALLVLDGPRGTQIFEQKSDKARIGGGIE